MTGGTVVLAAVVRKERIIMVVVKSGALAIRQGVHRTLVRILVVPLAADRTVGVSLQGGRLSLLVLPVPLVVAVVALLDRLIGLLPPRKLLSLGVGGALIVGPARGHHVPVGELFVGRLPTLGAMLLERGSHFGILQNVLPKRGLLLGQLRLHGFQLSVHLGVKGHICRENVLGCGLRHQTAKQNRCDG